MNRTAKNLGQQNAAMACIAMLAVLVLGCSRKPPPSDVQSPSSVSVESAASSTETAPAASSAASSDEGASAALPACAKPGNAGEFYALSAENLAETANVPMCSFRGKVVLIVNTASLCGNTPQYAPLEALFTKYSAAGFYVLGFPCNQFGGQEPGSGKEITSFCSTEYHITFPMFAKVDVNGADASPLYQWLKAQPGGSGDIDWNFAKFLIGRDGKFIKRWVAATQPDDSDVVAHIEAALAKR